jgi:hypothetical protein
MLYLYSCKLELFNFACEMVWAKLLFHEIYEYKILLWGIQIRHSFNFYFLKISYKQFRENFVTKIEAKSRNINCVEYLGTRAYDLIKFTKVDIFKHLNIMVKNLDKMCFEK